jgi:hypothetical protein
LTVEVSAVKISDYSMVEGLLDGIAPVRQRDG